MAILLALLSCSNNKSTNSTNSYISTDGVVVDAGSSIPSVAVNGLQVFLTDNPWNTDISQAPVHPLSAQYIASIGASVSVHPDFGTVWNGAPIGIPYMLVNALTPRRAVAFAYAAESDSGLYPIPDTVWIEGGAASDGDRHMIMVDTAAGKLYELWHAYPPGHPANPNKTTWYAGSGAIFNLRSDSLRPDGFTSADAAGLPIFPGLVRYDEAVTKGAITHALRVTVAKSQTAYIYPATHEAGSSSDSTLPPMGLRVRLKASVDTAGYSLEVLVIIRALKKYGLIVADNGSNWYISGAPDSRWSDEDLHELGQLKGSDFEAVQTGSLLH